MKNKTTKLGALRFGIFFALLLSSMTFTSCENKAVSPENPPKSYGDDPPKDTDPVRPPGS
jgi:hypothetical protein